MTRDVDNRIERLEERIDEAANFGDADRAALREFNNNMALLRSRFGKQRREKLLRHCIRIAEEVGGLADALEDKTVAEEIVRWIHDEYDNQESNRDYRVAFRVFGELAGEGDEIPESISWVSSTTSNNYDPKPDPANMLEWEQHILPMLDECRQARDKALIAVSWDSGARSGEIRNLTIGDVSDGKHGLQITVDGKTGQRSVTLFTSTPHLRQWLNVHPAKDDPDAPLWCKLEEPEELSYQMLLKILKKPARKAGITHTEVTFTRMRKSSASHLASQNLSQAHLEERYGWKRGSDAAARYISVFDKSSDRAIAKAHGVDVEEDEPDAIAPLVCPRCQNETPRNEDTCVWCGQAMEAESLARIEEEQRQVRTELLQVAREDPSLLDDIERFEQLIEFADENPGVIREAREFADATSS